MWMAGPCDPLSLLPASEARVALRVVFGRLGLVSSECDGVEGRGGCGSWGIILLGDAETLGSTGDAQVPHHCCKATEPTVLGDAGGRKQELPLAA